MDPLLAELRKGRSLYLLHANADADCVGSAHALARAFGGVVGESVGVAASARRLAERIGCAIDPMPHPAKFDRVVAVDASSRVQLGPLARVVDPASLLVVDHHAYGDLRDLARLHRIEPARASCAEVAWGLMREARVGAERDVALGLATAIAADTQRFRFGGLESLRAFLEIAEPHGITMKDCLAILEDEEPGEDLPRRIAALKAASRVEVTEHDGVLVATSEVSSFEANAAAGLVRLGADLAVVLAEKGGKARVSSRCSQALLDRGVHLGEIANALARSGEFPGWSGGGHDGSAGLNGTPPAARVRDAVVARALAGLATPR